MFGFTTQATIDRPASEVWSFLTDVDRYPEWMPVDNPRVLSGRPDEPGGRIGMLMNALGRKLDFEAEITEADRDRRIVWRVIRGVPFRGDYIATLEPAGPASTRVTYAGRFRLVGLWRLLQPLVALEMKKGESRELQRVKEMLEAPPARGVAPA